MRPTDKQNRKKLREALRVAGSMKIIGCKHGRRDELCDVCIDWIVEVIIARGHYVEEEKE